MLIKTEGLVAYYPFNVNVYDEGGNGFDATNVGAIPATDRFVYDNRVYAFDGNNGTERYIYSNIGAHHSALRILKKYDLRLPTYTNQYFNRTLFEILKHHKLFKEKIQKQEIRNGEPVVKYYLKRELITSHKARRSFITNANENKVSLSAIQASTGHTQLSTLSKYVKRKSNKQQLRAID